MFIVYAQRQHFCRESNFPKRFLYPHPVHLESNKQFVVNLYIDYRQGKPPINLK